jgi:hypothetical protein
MERCIKEARMINLSVQDMERIKQKSEVLQKAFQVLNCGRKPKLEQVRSLSQKIEELEMAQEGY